MDRSIISSDLVTIDKGGNLHEALRLMEKNHVSRLLVTDEGRIVGILTEEDIADRLSAGKERKLKSEHIHVSAAAVEDMQTIDADATEKAAARTMLDNKFSSLPVKSRGEIIGIITKTDLIKAVTSSKKEVRDFCTPEPYSVNPGDTVLQARMLMQEKGVHRLLVTNMGALQGIITERDIARGLQTFRKAIDKYPQADIQRLKVEDVASTSPITIKDSDTVGKAAKTMIEKGISSLPVAGAKFGILTKTDLVRGIAEGRLP